MTEHHERTPALAGPATAEESPAWWTAPAPPDWVLEHADMARIRDWRNAGPRRWAGRRPDVVFNPDLLLVADAAATGFVRFVLDLAEWPETPEWLADRTFRDLEAELAYRLLPECAKPGCSDKAPRLFTAAEPGPLAGRQREAGEEIRFCPKHGHDVWCAASGGPIADWLKPDAVRLDPLDALHAAAFAGDPTAYAEAVERLRRLTTFTPGPDA